MSKYSLQNVYADAVTLNGKTYQPGEFLVDTDDACAYVAFHESILPDAARAKLSFYKDADKQYIQAQEACDTINDVKEVFKTFKDPLVPPANNDQFDNNVDQGNETPESLGDQVPKRNITFGTGQTGEFTGEDPNIPPPQAPPAGEKEDRSDDEEPQKKTGGDPVNLFTGEFYLEKVDFELPSIGFPFVLIRTYKSGRTYFGPWGYNWDHNYNIYIRKLNDGNIALNTGRLQEEIYTPSGNGTSFNAPRGVFAILENQGTQSSFEFVLTFKDGMKWSFSRPAGWSHPERIPLLGIEDTNKNFQQLIYDQNNCLIQVIDTAGRKINFIYGNCGLLEALQPEFLQTPGQPPIEIKYMHANNIEQLSAVITFPTPDFPEGLITSYEYDEEQALPILQNNITRVIDAKGQTIVENFYGTDTTEDSFNRVVKQYFMGGEYFFKYTNIRYIPPFDEHINDAYLQTEFYEPCRPLKVFTFNFRGNLLDERYRLCADGSYRVWAQSYRYNRHGQLTEFYHANGMAEFFTYDEANNNPFAQGNLLKVELRSQPNRLLSRTITKFTYEPRYQKIKTSVDEAGETTTFTYEYENNPLILTGNLEEIKYPDATLSDGTVQANCVQTFHYDQLGQVIEQISPEGRKTTFEYYQAGNGAGQVKKITRHDTAASLTQSFEYDALGNLAIMKDASGNEIAYLYNLINQLIQVKLPPINGKRAVYKMEYNEDRKVAREYVPRGAYTDSRISGDWIINEYRYDVASWLVEATHNANTEFPQTTKYLRDFHGNIIKLTNPIGQESKFKYDERSLVLEEIQHTHSENPLITKYRYDRVGNLIKVTASDGNEQSFDYSEPFARLTSFKNHLGNIGQYTYQVGQYPHGIRDQVDKLELKADAAAAPFQTFTYLYDEKGRLKQASMNGLVGKVLYDKDDLTVATINHLGAATKYEHDGLGRTTRITDPIGNIRKNVFDANGNSSSLIQEFTSTQTGNVTSFNSQILYDSRNRPIQTVDPLGNIIQSIYDDRDLVTQVVNSLGQKASIYYNINGQAIRTTIFKPDGNEYTINCWHRDLVGRLTAFEDAEGNQTGYRYDERGFPTKIIYPDGTSIAKQYNALGFLQSEKDGNGTITTFTYNRLSQLTRLSFQNAANIIPAADIVFEYDALGRKYKSTQSGYVLQKEFDAFNRITAEKQGGESVKRIYDDLTNKVTLQFPDGREDVYQFDIIGRLKEIIFHKRGAAGCLFNQFAEETKLAEYQYDGIFLAAKKYANGVTTSYSYNQDGQLSKLEVKNASGGVLDAEYYLYDGEKRRKFTLRPTLPGQNKYFNYDELSRLVEAYSGITAPTIPANLANQQAIDTFLQNSVNINAAVKTEKYTLTDNDKRSAWQIGNIQYSPTYNNLLQLTALTATDGTNAAYFYDNNGNRISDANFNYSYDVFDNLSRVVKKTDGSILLENTYDPEGRLINRKINNTLTSFSYDGLRAVQEKNHQNQIAQNTFGMGLDEYIAQSKGQANYFCHQDTIQSIKSISGISGNILQYYDFESFGKPFVFNALKDPIGTDQSLIQPIFGGRPFISQLNLCDFRKRIYDPLNGQFIQRDVHQYSDSSSQYLYCKHNPINFSDPLGSEINQNSYSELNDLKENIKILLKDTGFGIWNAFSAGAPEKIYSRKSSGDLATDLFYSSLIGSSSFLNMISLGFQDSIKQSIGQVHEEMMDLAFQKGYDPSDLVSTIWIGTAGTFVGVVQGAVRNVGQLLPIGEVEVLRSDNATLTDKLVAGSVTVSKVANLVAFGASVKGNVLPNQNKTEILEVGIAERTGGAKSSKDFHASTFFPREEILFERHGSGTDLGFGRPRAFGEGESWEETYNTWIKIQVSKNSYVRAFSYATSRIGEKGFNFYSKNCSLFARDILSQAGVKDIIGFAPELLKMTLENPNLMKGIKAGYINSAVQSTENKK